MIMRSEKGFIRHLLRGLSIRVLEQEATLARESRQEVLSHSDILSTHPPTQDREMNREREGERKTERMGELEIETVASKRFSVHRLSTTPDILCKPFVNSEP